MTNYCCCILFLIFYCERGCLSLSLPSGIATVMTATAILLNDCNSYQYSVGKEIGDAGGSGTGRVYEGIVGKPSLAIGQSPVAVKVSWAKRLYLNSFPFQTPASAVEKECRVLQKLEAASVENVVRCLTSCYDKGFRKGT